MTSGDLRIADDHGGTKCRTTVKHREKSWVRGNVVMKGYYNDPAATAQAFRGGWFHTGDAAVVHADGYAEIRDRIKDIIISGGENISSVEVEGVLLRHDAVQEVSVVGMPHPKWGEAAHAFVVLRPGKTATEAELIQFARDHLAHFKTPSWVSFVERSAEDRDRQNTKILAARPHGQLFPNSRFLRPSSSVDGGRRSADGRS